MWSQLICSLCLREILFHRLSTQLGLVLIAPCEVGCSECQSSAGFQHELGRSVKSGGPGQEWSLGAWISLMLLSSGFVQLCQEGQAMS